MTALKKCPRLPAFVALAVSSLSIALISCDGGNSHAPRPNIIIILADDLGFGDTSGYGATLVDTPNIDRLIEEGRRFTDAHTPSSICTPTRYALLTGRYTWRGWLKSGLLFSNNALLIEEGRETIASYLQGLGYRTGHIGKWHLGLQNEEPVNWNVPLSPGPLEVGFDYYFGVPVSPNLPPYVYVENHDVVDRQPGEIIEVVGLTEVSGIENYRKSNEIGRRTTDKAVEFINENKEDPFFLYFATSSVHSPLTPDDEFLNTSPLGVYGDFVHEFDWSVGRILDALDENDITDNTLVIVTSDNGAWTFFTCGTEHAANGPYRGHKGMLTEGAHRVPFIARWPNVIPEDTESSHLVNLVDLFATIGTAVNANIPQDTAEDSQDRWYAFVDDPAFPPPESESTIHHSWHGKFAIRVDNWKYIPAQEPLPFTATVTRESEFSGLANGCLLDFDTNPTPEQLYDLDSDVTESTNLVDIYPEIVSELAQLLQETIAEP